MHVCICMYSLSYISKEVSYTARGEGGLNFNLKKQFQFLSEQTEEHGGVVAKLLKLTQSRETRIKL